MRIKIEKRRINRRIMKLYFVLLMKSHMNPRLHASLIHSYKLLWEETNHTKAVFSHTISLTLCHLLSPHRVLSSSRRYTPLHTNTDSP